MKRHGIRVLALYARPMVVPPVVFQTDVFFGSMYHACHPSEQIDCVIMQVKTPRTNHSQAVDEDNTEAYFNACSTCSSHREAYVLALCTHITVGKGA